MKSFPIYLTSRGGQDTYCDEVVALNPVEALETWANMVGATDHTGITQDGCRVIMPFANSVLFYYTYAAKLAKGEQIDGAEPTG